ncbi:GyrI-like domain-containing protein [Mucilaginibacter sp.]|uniref:GyrI-like domain-containing protein n=1 Tax=Mucilaginibacter sp. TaxID=1882438 RepID=UPI0032642C07
MKKPALLVLGILLLAFISIYFIIPQNITATSTVTVDATDGNVFKFLVKKEAWPKWWPGEHDPKDSDLFAYNGMMYTIKKDANSYIEVNINTTKVELDSKINYLAADDGATTISWEAVKQSSLNPFERISEFVRIKAEQTDMDSILSRFKQFIQKDSNVYGLGIKINKVKDGIMLATNAVTKTPPSVEMVYGMVADLRKQIAAQNATETNKPMLNINKVDDSEYHVMVAVPINKEIKPGANSVVNKMVVGGNILTTEVKGGRNTIDNAMGQLQNFRKDYKLTGVAMPFELMITDRTMEKDTSKWVTQLYWPIL